jgi:hypothetical protein
MQPALCDFSAGILRRRFQKTQAKRLYRRDKKVTELLPIAVCRDSYTIM